MDENMPCGVHLLYMNNPDVCRLFIPRACTLDFVERFWDRLVGYRSALQAAEKNSKDPLHGLLGSVNNRLFLAFRRDPETYREVTGSTRHPKPKMTSTKYTRRLPRLARALVADRKGTKDFLEPALSLAHAMGYTPFWNTLRYPVAVRAATTQVDLVLAASIDPVTQRFRDEELVSRALMRWAADVHNPERLAEYERKVA